jgi:hypothetical protein
METATIGGTIATTAGSARGTTTTAGSARRITTTTVETHIAEREKLV